MSAFSKAKKLVNILLNSAYRYALRIGVAAAVEHEAILRTMECETVVDIGANRGQFSLVARDCFPKAKIYSFEPLEKPASLFRKLFVDDKLALLHVAAIGPKAENCIMHVSGRDDSSSLLPISSLQEEIFPGTGAVGTTNVRVAPLDTFVSDEDINAPALLKLDVQGFELEALNGCESRLSNFEWVYCECSFVELYSGQELVSDVINWLFDRGFRINGIYNPSYDHNGQTVQADFLFRRTY